MSNLRLVIEYDGFKAEERILLKDTIQELLRRVKMKQGPCLVDEVTHQVVNELNSGITSGSVLRKLVRLIVDQINQEPS